MTPVEWIENNLHFPPVISSPLVAGKPVRDFIIPFQREVLKSVLVDNKDVFIGFSRQISKSSLFTWTAIYLMENESCQGVTMGPTFGQAEVIFRSIKKHIEFSPVLKKKYKLKAEVIENKENGSLLKKVYNSPAANLGQMALRFILFDEICTYDEKAKQNLLTLLAGLAMTGTKPLLLYATNPPLDSEHWSLDFIKKLRTDPQVKFFEFSADKKEDIYSKHTWAKANPFIAHYLKTKKKIYEWTYRFYEAQAKAAKDSPVLELDFRRQQLGQRVSAEALKFCEVDRIKTATESVYEDKSLRWCLGIDPAWKFNFFAASLMGFSDDTHSVFIKPFLFMANVETRRPSQKFQLTEWAGLGYLKLFHKDTIPRFKAIKPITHFIKQKKLHIEKVIVDPGQAKAWEFEKEFSKVEYVYNSPRHMTGPIRYLEKIIHDKKCFLIGKNPAVISQFDSAIVSVKSQDYCSIDKASGWASVDIVVASTLAMKHLSETNKKTYEAFYC